MKNEKDLNFFKNFLDLIPEPLVILKKKNLKFFFVNLEFQIQFEKSQSKLKDISMESIFSKSSFLISNLKKLKDKVGMFLIKEATLFRNSSYEVRCIIPENYKQMDRGKFYNHILLLL